MVNPIRRNLYVTSFIRKKLDMNEETLNHNKWARRNIKYEDQMICLDCGAVVDYKWMIIDMEKKVGQRYAPCYFKTVSKTS